MSENAPIERRTVLKAASTSVLFGGVGTVSGMETDKHGSVNLVEAGIRYSLPDGYYYDDYHVDTLTDYWINYSQSQLVLRRKVSPSTRSLVRASRHLVNARDLTSNATSVSESERTQRLPTELSNRHRMSEYVSLDDFVTQPSAEVRYRSAEPVLRIDDTEHRLPAGDEVAVSLEPITVTARTRRVTDKKAELPGVPDRKLGYEIERGTANVAVVPEVVATNYGELDVVEIV